MTATLRSLYM